MRYNQGRCETGATLPPVAVFEPHPRHHVSRHALLASDRAQPIERGIRHRDTHQSLLIGLGAIGLEPEPAHQWREAESLHHQRHEDHAEGDEDDQLTRRKKRAPANAERKCERDDERVRTAKAGP